MLCSSFEFILFFSGGHMRTDLASITPEIWLHHAFLDAIWDQFQKKGRDYKFHKLKRSGNHFDLLLFKGETKADEFIDNQNLAGCSIKVMYQNIFHEDKGSAQTTEVYSGPYQTSKIKRFTRIIKKVIHT